MSAHAAIASLPDPVKTLVLEATKASTDDDSAFGRTEKDKAEVTSWIENIVKGEITKPASAQTLDTALTPLTYLVSSYPTAADIALYASLHPSLAEASPATYYAHPALTRYFDHIQHLPAVRGAPSAPALVPLDLDGAPKLERKADPPKEKKKKDAAAAPGAQPEGKTGVKEKAKKGVEAVKEKVQDAVAAVASGSKEKAPKEKKEKKDKGGAPPKAAAAAEDSGEPIPSMIDLRVGHIVEIAKHPDADGLYVEQIDFGEESGPRTVVSGLVNYIPIEEMRDKYLVGVCNLKPANMRGVKSFAMVLCATSKDGKDAGIELVQPPANSKPGDRVYFEGGDFEEKSAISQLNPKKKIFETIQPGFTTLETHEAAWVNPQQRVCTGSGRSEGVCIAPKFVGASLS